MADFLSDYGHHVKNVCPDFYQKKKKTSLWKLGGALLGGANLPFGPTIGRILHSWPIYGISWGQNFMKS